MNFEFLKDKIKEKFKSQENFADAIGVTRPTVSAWVNDKNQPEDSRFLDIVNALDLNEDEVSKLMGVPETSVVFRKFGSTAVEEDIQKRSISLADTFFKIDGSSYVISGSFFSISANTKDHLAVAEYIRTFLDLKPNEPAKFGETLNKLKKYNINVFFVPFEKIGIRLPTTTSRGTSNREVAFTAIKGNRIIIFVDTNRTIDEANFDICHELTHIVLGHSKETTKEEEDFCNQVARELIYPTAFFREKSAAVAPFLNATKFGWPAAVNTFKELRQDFDWSPMGLALTLKENDYFKSNSHEFRRLMKMDSNNSPWKRTIEEVHFKTFETNDFDAMTKFFSEDIFKYTDLFKPFLELRDAASSGRLSPRRLSEILNIDSGDADELARLWIAEQGAEESQDDHESADQ